MEFGAATFGVNCMYQGKEGIYEITMPMETEGVVVGGRETYGEPKKLLMSQPLKMEIVVLQR